MSREAVDLTSFVMGRLESMSARPKMWAASTESFIVQLVLLVEVIHLGSPERFSSSILLAELCGPGAGCMVPADPITAEWAATAVTIARKYAIPGPIGER